MTSADVIQELRAARPGADDALRARVQAIAAREPERRPSPFARFTGWRRGALIAVPAAAALAVATAGAIGLAGSGDGEGGRLAVQSPNRDSALEKTESTPFEQNQALAPSLGAAGGPAAGSAVSPPTDRAQRFSATLTLEVAGTDELADATQRAQRIARELGGFAASVSYASAESGVSSMTLRIPSERVQDAIAKLSQLGTVVGQQLQVDDLQEGLDELRARQTVLRARIARLTAQLGASDLNTVERAALEARRRAARAELAGITASVRATVEQASLATIQLALQTDEQSAVPTAPSRLDRALDRAVGVLAWEGVALLFAAIVTAPFLAIALATAIWRHTLRRRGETSLLGSH
jgi:hypothetical protein